MHKVALLAAVCAAGLAATPALADITIFDTPSAVQPPENVLFQSEDPMGSTAFGVTNQTMTDVTFEGVENLLTPSDGQARIEAADGGMGNLTFFLTDSTLGFTEVEFNIFGTQATATSVGLDFTDDSGTVFSDSFEIVNGQNFFSASALNGQFITRVSLTLNGDVQDVRQVRLGGVSDLSTGIAVPEPATWAMLLGGFGLAGAALRRRAAKPVRVLA
jgi:hypothetical protein